MPTAILAEDEPILREQLAGKLARLWPELELLACVGDGAAALEALARRAPDFLFLDIRMPEASGVEVALAAAGRCHVVFVTAYDEYAIEAFETGAVDYILKPASDERLAKAIARLKSRLASPPADVGDALARLAERLAPSRERLRWIKASVGASLRLIPVADVLFFQSDEKYTRVVTAEGEALIKTPIRELLEGLDPDAFWQIHRSTVVNVNAIAGVSRDFRGQAHVKVRGREETLAVSRVYSHLFRQM